MPEPKKSESPSLMSSKRQASSIGDCGCGNGQLPDRDFRIDLFRGLSLWLIFLDHIPETYFNNFTLGNLGFSDAAEILVFLSGLASGFVYADVARRSGFAAASRRVLRRSFEI